MNEIVKFPKLSLALASLNALMFATDAFLAATGRPPPSSWTSMLLNDATLVFAMLWVWRLEYLLMLRPKQ